MFIDDLVGVSIMEFELIQQFSGYVRGCRRMTVKADSKEEALAQFEKYLAEVDIVRDDTVCDEVVAEQVMPAKSGSDCKEGIAKATITVVSKSAKAITSLLKRVHEQNK